MLAKIFSSAIQGIDARAIEIEVFIANGLPNTIIVGLPDASVRESKDRIKAAIKNTGFTFSDRRITVNLAPADVPKEGPAYDLPIALGILEANDQLGVRIPNNTLFMGELALDGAVRRVRGILPAAIAAKESGYRRIVVPQDNVCEAAIVDGIDVYPVTLLAEAIRLMQTHFDCDPFRMDQQKLFEHSSQWDIDMEDVKGQHYVKRALEIAAAGSHNVILIGPPGSGKTMLAKRLPTILPFMTVDEAIETTKIHSISGLLKKDHYLVATRPFYAPHHTVSDIGLIGGGSHAKPGDISLAHHGILFLDEFPEFKRGTLEALRQPLENGNVTISRARCTVSYPARFMLVAAMNPCPCGYYTDPKKECHCTPTQIRKYLSKISGPLLDRIDLHIEVPSVKFKDLKSNSQEESSDKIRMRVNQTRRIQETRFSQDSFFCNSHMESKHIKRYCPLSPDADAILSTAITKLGMSARTYDRLLRVGRTIADLDGEDMILEHHMAEAIQYRSLDRNLFC